MIYILVGMHTVGSKIILFLHLGIQIIGKLIKIQCTLT